MKKKLEVENLAAGSLYKSNEAFSLGPNVLTNQILKGHHLNIYDLRDFHQTVIDFEFYILNIFLYKILQCVMGYEKSFQLC
jgi:hypothetical protein